MAAAAENKKPRVGLISYTNCIPFYHGLGGYDFYKAVPAEINRVMHLGEIDIAPVSSLEYLNHSEDYYLLPQPCIAARQFSSSVLLFSKKKIEALNGSRIAVTRESLSSAALLKILLKGSLKFENEFEVQDSDPESMLERFPAALVIGDGALFFQPKDFVFKYDLAELWWNWTEKPFCFAVWAVRRSFADACPEAVENFSRELQKNTKRNLENLEQLIKEAAGLSFLDARFSKVFGYLFNLQYDLTEEVLQSLELYYRLAHRHKLSPKPEPIQFFEPVRD